MEEQVYKEIEVGDDALGDKEGPETVEVGVELSENVKLWDNWHQVLGHFPSSTLKISRQNLVFGQPRNDGMRREAGNWRKRRREINDKREDAREDKRREERREEERTEKRRKEERKEKKREEY